MTSLSITGLICIGADITEQTKIEKTLVDSEARLIEAEEIALSGSITVDITDSTLPHQWSPGFYRILGLKPGEVEPTMKAYIKFVHPADRGKVSQIQQQSVTGKKKSETEYRIIRSDGTMRWMKAYIAITRDDNKIPLKMTGLMRDITENRQTQDRILQEKNKLQALMDSSGGGVTIQDTEYNIIYQNKFLKDKFSGVGEKCYSVYEGKKCVCEGCPVKKAFSDGKSHTSERKVVMPNGEITFSNNIASPIKNSNGEVTSCVEFVINITDRKNAYIWEEMANSVLNRLNETEVSIKTTIRDIIQIIRNSMNIEALGIRLSEGEDFPYYQTSGFSEHFVEMERYLCERDETGEIVCDAQGNSEHECMCGNILRGRDRHEIFLLYRRRQFLEQLYH